MEQPAQAAPPFKPVVYEYEDHGDYEEGGSCHH